MLNLEYIFFERNTLNEGCSMERNKYKGHSANAVVVDNEVIRCMSDCISLTEEQKRTIAELIYVKKFKKGTILLKPGNIPDSCYHVFKGCVRQYYLNDGEEKTAFFYTEDQSIIIGNPSTKPVKYYLECVEDCTLSITTFENERELYRRYPQFETLCREGVEEELDKWKDVLATFMTTSPEERYLNLLENRPGLLDRVPQYQLASYLGVKPESLSRIRKRISVKK